MTSFTIPVGFDLRLTPETMKWLAENAIQQDLNDGDVAETYTVVQAFVRCFHNPDLIDEMFKVGLLNGYAVTPLWGQLPADETDAQFAPHVTTALALLDEEV